MLSGVFLSLERYLLIHLCPRVLECYRAVEYEFLGRRILIHIEVSDTLELQVIQRLSVSQILLDVALGEDLQ